MLKYVSILTMNINPIALSIGPLHIKWYGIAYAIGLLMGVWILNRLNQKRKVFKDLDQILDFAFIFFFCGVIIGGRLGYVLFYDLPYYLAHPFKIIAIWEGGMSFFGGLIASFLATIWFCKKHKIQFLALADLVVIPGSLALVFTRTANFINQELIGRVIINPNWKWLGVDFGDGLLRYPSPLFQAFADFILFLILLLTSLRIKTKGVVFSLYLIFYGTFRLVTEFWREPDPQIGFIINFLTINQVFSLGLMLIGFSLLFKLSRKN